ncbi:MAG: DUF6382 domain-containing protein [Agathobacter sp.]|nr:DUF6382 domain-containing protein [Agathobacter sp.]
MINREILYERNLTGSYMKIPVSLNAKFDEKIMLKRKLPGILPVERCFVNGYGQYWYNISGKQSLDTYCKVRNIGIDFIERMIISICNQIEILEWNLIDTNSLMLDPELVFVTNQNGEIIFTIYPGEHTSLTLEFQQLMEYLLTKIDHSDTQAVQAAYAIYEKTLDDTYSIVDIRDIIVSKKEENVDPVKMHEKTQQERLKIDTAEAKASKETKKEKIIFKLDNVRNKDSWISKIIDSILKYIDECKNKKEYESNWITPEIEDYNEEPDIVIQNNPTVCLSNYKAKPRGMLLYDGLEELENISLTGNTIRLGKGVEADVLIDKATISKFHAKIEKTEADFYIEDLNSTNGTMVNGEALSYKERRKLEINDIVQLADVQYKFV